MLALEGVGGLGGDRDGASKQFPGFFDIPHVGLQDAPGLESHVAAGVSFHCRGEAEARLGHFPEPLMQFC